MKRFNIALAAFMLLSASAFAQRPHTPFVEKCYTPERARQLKVALNTNLWVMYDLPTAELYMAWQGGANGGTLQLANYWFGNYAHFPHWFIVSGKQYFKENVGEYFASWAKPADITYYYTKWPKQPLNYKNWTVTNASNQDAGAKVRYRGYMVQGDLFQLNFGLILANGTEISVNEVPDYSNAGGKTNLVRKMTLAGIPAGYTVSLALPSGGNWAVTGAGSLSGSSLVQKADGVTTVTGSW